MGGRQLRERVSERFELGRCVSRLSVLRCACSVLRVRMRTCVVRLLAVAAFGFVVICRRPHVTLESAFVCVWSFFVFVYVVVRMTVCCCCCAFVCARVCV